MGIVLPEPGYHDALRALCAETGTLLIIDETHTFSAGPGGCTQAWGLQPDLLTIGKAIGGGVPCGALGLSADVEARMLAAEGADYVDTGGIGGTLAGNPLSLAAIRATLGSVLTDDVWERTIPLAARWAAGVRAAAPSRWDVSELGCRAEYRFGPARNGTEAHLIADHGLERFLHLYALNRGVLITPFHNMALMAPTTTEADVDRHTEAFGEAVAELLE
jgi:glutamate-1-semialdehyde 2,1-aminomutase